MEEYEQKVVTPEELDEIFIEYFRIFVKDPEKGSMEKVLKFMKSEGEKFKLIEFIQDFRDYFAISIKYLKDYYAYKFKELKKDGLLL